MLRSCSIIFWCKSIFVLSKPICAGYLSLAMPYCPKHTWRHHIINTDDQSWDLNFRDVLSMELWALVNAHPCNQPFGGHQNHNPQVGLTIVPRIKSHDFSYYPMTIPWQSYNTLYEPGLRIQTHHFWSFCQQRLFEVPTATGSGFVFGWYFPTASTFPSFARIVNDSTKKHTLPSSCPRELTVFLACSLTFYLTYIHLHLLAFYLTLFLTFSDIHMYIYIWYLYFIVRHSL